MARYWVATVITDSLSIKFLTLAWTWASGSGRHSVPDVAAQPCQHAPSPLVRYATDGDGHRCLPTPQSHGWQRREWNVFLVEMRSEGSQRAATGGYTNEKDAKKVQPEKQRDSGRDHEEESGEVCLAADCNGTVVVVDPN